MHLRNGRTKNFWKIVNSYHTDKKSHDTTSWNYFRCLRVNTIFLKNPLELLQVYNLKSIFRSNRRVFVLFIFYNYALLQKVLQYISSLNFSNQRRICVWSIRLWIKKICFIKQKGDQNSFVSFVLKFTRSPPTRAGRINRKNLQPDD